MNDVPSVGDEVTGAVADSNTGSGRDAAVSFDRAAGDKVTARHTKMGTNEPGQGTKDTTGVDISRAE